MWSSFKVQRVKIDFRFSDHYVRLAHTDFYRLNCRPRNNLSWHLSQFNIPFILVQVSATDDHMNGVFFI